MNWVYVVSIAGLFWAFGARAEDMPAQPLVCPHCGPWQVSSATDVGLVGEVVGVDARRITIPGCGVFRYAIEESHATPRSHNRYTYYVSMALTLAKSSGLCAAKGVPKWRLAIESEGHFHDGGMAQFTLWRTAPDEEVLGFTGWNMDREDPCGAGSGVGAAACVEIANARAYRALSAQATEAHRRLLIAGGSATVAPFNAAHFVELIEEFCTEREKNSGGGYWPIAHAQECRGEMLEAKRKEFEAWTACAQAAQQPQRLPAPAKPLNDLCPLPDESFDRTPKSEDE